MAFGKAPTDDTKINPINPINSLPTQGPGLGSQNMSTTSSSSLGAFLGNGSKITGQLHFTGPVEVDGIVEGEIVAQDKLTIGEAATIKGTIHGSEILVKGTINGDIIASKKLVLKKPAKIVGNIATPSLTIEEGVTFDGKCVMGGQSQGKSAGKAQEIKLSAASPVAASA